MKILQFIFFLVLTVSASGQPSAKDLVSLIDRNLAAKTRIMKAKMIVGGARGSRSIEFNVWTEGEKKSFTEYTEPAREKGTKMLKLEDKLWIFSPSTDRIIQITGQMLRQSLMGSDLSYEDMMNNGDLASHYKASITGSDTAQGRKCWLLRMEAVSDNEAYQLRVIRVDQERNIPLSEELYAKSGKLLKKMLLTDYRQIQGRWYPMKMIFKDMLKSGEGTSFIIETVKLDDPIPENMFSKSSLK
jgi:outer membrane lipoprotein-sorting protein